MDALRDRIEAIFEAALERPVADRPVFLAEACGGDTEVRREVEALLAAHGRAAGILESDAAGIAGELEQPAIKRIGAYHVLRRLGRGGMGEVYLAERVDGQFRRRVAIKVLRSGADDLPLYRRFLAERQILASLDHPNIARMFDGGVTDEALPYLVMEYVDGLRLTEYCDRNRLGIDDRLRLFGTVCGAVHYAHQNLVIHRDLKPSNILVTAEGQVKLLDFGIAKLLGTGLNSMVAPVTHTDIRVMTPEYASPEQIRGDPLTTASDVYSLGVLLYELLAGRHPYRLARASAEELVRAVLERDPERPSTRVVRTETLATGDGELRELTPAAVGQARGLSPDRLRRRLSGDLDAIVMAALRKEPNRRYASADLLNQDIERYLEGLPVAAHSGNRTYRLTRFVRRHWLGVAAAAVVAVSLLGGAATALWQASLASSERDRAEAARQEAEVALGESRAVSDFLLQLFSATDPTEAGGDTISARELLRRGVERAEQLDATPAVQARMFDVVGRVHENLGSYAQARRLLERALALRRETFGEQHAEVAETMIHLAALLRRTGDYGRSIELYERAVAIRRNLFGMADTAGLRAMVALAGMYIYHGRFDDSERTYRDALQIQEDSLGRNHPEVAGTLINLAGLMRRRGRDGEAESMFRRALRITQEAFGDEDTRVAGPMFHLADMIWKLRRDTAEALRLYSRGVEIMRRSLGESHPDFIANYGRMAGALHEYGRWEEAERVYRETIALRSRVLGPNHPQVAITRSSLASLLFSRGRLDESEREFLASLRDAIEMLGPEHSAIAGIYINYSRLLAHRGDLALAEARVREALRIRRLATGPETPLVGLTLGELASVVGARGDFAAADSLFRESFRLMRAELPEHHEDVLRTHALAARFYEDAGRPEIAATHRSAAGAEYTLRN